MAPHGGRITLGEGMLLVRIHEMEEDGWPKRILSFLDLNRVNLPWVIKIRELAAQYGIPLCNSTNNRPAMVQ